MKFSSSADNLGIVERIDDLCDSDSTSYPTSRKTAVVNGALESLIGEIIKQDGTFQFDDSNFTTLPTGKADLVAGQKDYSFNVAMLNILRAKVKDINGIWRLLRPFDPSEIDIPTEEFMKTDGLPQFYDKNGSSILLYPGPSAAYTTLTEGLEVDFQRTGSLFVATDTTKEPGFASPYHEYLVYEGAIPHCMKYHKDRVVPYQNKANAIKAACIAFYGKRQKDVPDRMTMKPINFR